MADLKKMIAYSSISHMGFVLLGLASLTVEGVNGAVFQLFSHGIISPALFLIAGVIYDRSGDRLIENYRGLANATTESGGRFNHYVLCFFRTSRAERFHCGVVCVFRRFQLRFCEFIGAAMDGDGGYFRYYPFGRLLLMGITTDVFREVLAAQKRVV